MDKHLLLKTVLVILGCGLKKCSVFSGAAYNLLGFGGEQLRKKFIFSGHGISLPHGYGDFHRNSAVLDRGIQEPRSGIGYFRHHLIEPAYRAVDFLLAVSVVVTALVAANRVAILPQTVNFPAQAPSVNGKEPLQLTAVNGSFSTGMVLFEILADCCFPVL